MSKHKMAIGFLFSRCDVQIYTKKTKLAMSCRLTARLVQLPPSLYCFSDFAMRAFGNLLPAATYLTQV